MESLKKFIKEKNYWPHTVILMIVGIIIASGFTIKIAVENPVHEDDIFLDTYQNVDENINEILISQHQFTQKYEIKVNDKLNFGENSLKIKVIDKSNGNLVENAKVTLLVTRPETTEFDQKIENLKYENGSYIANSIKIEKKGRWFVMPKVEINELTGFGKFEYNGTQSFERIYRKR